MLLPQGKLEHALIYRVGFTVLDYKENDGFRVFLQRAKTFHVSIVGDLHCQRKSVQCRILRHTSAHSTVGTNQLGILVHGLSYIEPFDEKPMQIGDLDRQRSERRRDRVELHLLDVSISVQHIITALNPQSIGFQCERVLFVDVVLSIEFQQIRRVGIGSCDSSTQSLLKEVRVSTDAIHQQVPVRCDCLGILKGRSGIGVREERDRCALEGAILCGDL